MVKPFPNALKNDVWEVAGLTNGTAASAMLIVDSGNREDTPVKVDESDETSKVGGEVVVDGANGWCCFETFIGQHTSLEQEGP